MPNTLDICIHCKEPTNASTKVRGRNLHLTCYRERGAAQRALPGRQESKEQTSKRYYDKNKESILKKNKLWREANLSKSREDNARWRAANKQKIKERKAAKAGLIKQQARVSGLKRRYGLSAERYDEMAARQGGVCAICEKPPGTKPLHVDHDHGNGSVRGLLCSKCNLGLGLFSDDMKMLHKAISYISGSCFAISIQSKEGQGD